MGKEDFFKLLSEEVSTYKAYLETDDSQWIIKGFIDVNKHVYTITNDTKVVSKILEVLLLPKLEIFAHRNGLTLELPSKQNFYPDITFKDSEGHLFAVDFKSSYYDDSDKVNGLTLGSYWGYFRNRDEKKSMDYTYNEYSSHIVLGILYKKADLKTDERKVFDLEEMSDIKSVIDHFIIFVQPKWKIASDNPGSGNTRNIGGEHDIDKIINGKGVFSELGEDVFDQYWMNYFNAQDARNAGIGTPKYNNISTFKAYLEVQGNMLKRLKL